MAARFRLCNERRNLKMAFWYSLLENHLFGVFDSKSGEVSSSYKPKDSKTTNIIAFPKPAKPGSNWEEWEWLLTPSFC
jgi:hypothetical protein